MSDARRLATVALVVREYDEAIDWFTRALGFVLIEDTALGAGKRWVRVGPAAGGASLLLSRATDASQREAIGRQAGGRVFLFLETDDIARDLAAMRANGVVLLEEPRVEPYGTVAVFRDLYGNRWDLVQPAR